MLLKTWSAKVGEKYTTPSGVNISFLQKFYPFPIFFLIFAFATALISEIIWFDQPSQ